jgi:dimethylglycine catabolism A
LRAALRSHVVGEGGGVGGLEAARVLATRGHRVTLIEQEPVLGGQLRIAAKLAWRESLLSIARWLESQVHKLGVNVVTGVPADLNWVAAQQPDAVILATGGRANLPGVPGIEHAITTWDALALADDLAGQRCLVFDDNGREVAASCAEHLAGRGADVCFMTADPQPLPLLERTTRPTFMRHLHAQGVRFITDTRLQEIAAAPDGLAVRCTNEYTAATRVERCDRVVVDYGTIPDNTLYEALQPASRNLGELDLDAFIAIRPQALVRNPAGAFDLFRIGDAISSRNVHAAIYDANRLASAI